MNPVMGRSLRSEVLVLCAVSVLLVAGLTGGIGYQLLKQQQQQQIMLSLHNLADERATEIEAYLDSRVGHLSESSRLSDVAIAMQQLNQAYQQGVESAAYQLNDGNFRPMFESMIEH